ncbi:TetR/AcrR family transcriptional regulator [Saccharopolyspora sp. NPDC000359]|uniref:TetR/AcrR family transcriptional regulator n=1 Tax=Saccharopolyspora sp. NPDC000359 TaxID=3154251 RepID=UPI003316658B
MAAEQRRLQPRKQPRQVRAELTRQRILTAAARVFAEHGYAAGTTNRIAERAGISIGSLYQYYPNKDAILAELLTRHLEADRSAETLRHQEEPLEDIIRAFVRAVIDNHHDDPRLLRILSDQAPRSTELLELMAQHQREIHTNLHDLLNNHPEVHVQDKHTATHLVASTVEYTVHPLIATPGEINPTHLEEELVTMLTTYLRTR